MKEAKEESKTGTVSLEMPTKSTAPNHADSGQQPEKEKGENGNAKKAGGPKGKKRKRQLKDLTAPRLPKTGYVRFLVDRREKIRADNPTLPFAEITKMLAAEWSVLPADQKQAYLNAAEEGREKYVQEMAAYKQSDAYKLFTQQLQQVKKSASKEEEKEEEEIPPVETEKKEDSDKSDIPIFTEAFLEHNKERESELRQLRKRTTDYEQQNATIETYVAGLQTAVDKINAETQQFRNCNAALKDHLQKLKVMFADMLTNVSVPGLDKVTAETVESSLPQLTDYIAEHPSGSVISGLRKNIMNMDLQA